MAAKSETIRASVMDHPANRQPPERKFVKREEVKHSYWKVLTITRNDEVDSEKFFDCQAYGSMNWLRKHQLWAADHGMTIELYPSNEAEAKEYIDAQAARLQQKFAKAS